MFDQITTTLINGAPPLANLDLDRLPLRFTNVFTEIVAARVRLRGELSADVHSEKLKELLDEMRRLAASQEALVSTAPDREDRASAAFVSAAAHQLCLMAEVSEHSRHSYINATCVAPEICATLLFLIADAQPDATEMAKQITVVGKDNTIAEVQIANAIKDLASGRLFDIRQVDPTPIDDCIGLDAAVDALLRRLHQGVVTLAEELLARPDSNPSVSVAQEIFTQVKSLSVAPIEDVFESDGPFAVSIFPGPLHLATLLLAASRSLIDANLCRVLPPEGVSSDDWWQIIQRTSRNRPYLWRNHRDAITQGYLTPGVSAAISFPTGAGKSTLFELKIAATLLTDKKVVVLAPTLALVDQTASALKKLFDNYNVLGDQNDEDIFSLGLDRHKVLVSTPERCLLFQSIQPEAFKDIGLVVVTVQPSKTLQAA